MHGDDDPELDARIAKVRHELAILARRSSSRVVANDNPGRPSKWWPSTVKSEALDMPFTESGAWLFVADCLERGAELEEIVLRKPEGKFGYVMKVRVQPNHDLLYIKLQLGAGTVIGRSFHYSMPDGDDE